MSDECGVKEQGLKEGTSDYSKKKLSTISNPEISKKFICKIFNLKKYFKIVLRTCKFFRIFSDEVAEKLRFCEIFSDPRRFYFVRLVEI